MGTTNCVVDGIVNEFQAIKWENKSNKKKQLQKTMKKIALVLVNNSTNVKSRKKCLPII
jgi:hypothetical protein